MVTQRWILHGRVQGVGMRYFIHRSARKFDLKGYVKNRSNGTVEAVVQGPRKVVSTLLEVVRNSAPGYIETLEQTEIDTTKEYGKFQIKLF